MSTFAQLAALPAPGVVFQLDVSYDDFVTTHYRWATVGINMAGTWYEGRLASVGKISKALGVDSVLTGCTCTVAVDNTDLVADWLVDRSTFASRTARVSFKLWLCLYDPTSPTDIQRTQLGKFGLLDNPRRNGAQVMLSLVDDLLGRVGTVATMPSVNDWRNATDAARPGAITSGRGSAAKLDANGFDWDAPAPLLFGAGPHVIQRITYNHFLICARVSSGGTSISMTLRDRFGVAIFGTSTITRSAIITKGNLDWRLYWVTIDFANTNGTYSATLRNNTRYADTWAILARSNTYGALSDALDSVSPITVSGSPFSQVSNFNSSGDTAFVHPATVVKDLVASYALVPMSVDNTSYVNTLAARAGARASGSLQQTRAAGRGTAIDVFSSGDLVRAISGLAVIGHFDVVFSADGTTYFKPFLQDFETYTITPTSIAETLMRDVEDYIASKGERNAPVTRLSLNYRGTRFGPYVNAARETAFNTPLEKTVDVSWAAPSHFGDSGNYGPQYYEDISYLAIQEFLIGAWDSQALRPVLRFTTTLAASTLELGNYITATWSRGGIGSPYAAAKWRVEGLALLPENGLVEVVAAWADEVAVDGVKPWLLDDETLIERAAGSGGRTLTLTSADATVEFSSGNLVSDGVVAGDILLVRDPAEAVGAFARNRAYRIASVTDADTLELTENFSGGGTFAGIADWIITRGALTYHTAITDPTNYPSGGVMYGKIADSTHAGKFSDNSTIANTMLDP